MKPLSLLIGLLPALSPVYGQVAFVAKGIGGGGALFAPSFNPANDNAFYVASDMGGLFLTSDFGATYIMRGFTDIQAGPASRVSFTNIANIQYCIDYSEDEAVPVKSMNGGYGWSPLPGNPNPSEVAHALFADYGQPLRLVLAYRHQVHFSTDGGLTFSLVHSAVNPAGGLVVAGVFFYGNQIFIGTSDGLLVSSDGGATFAMNAVTGLPAGQELYSFAGARQGNTIRFFCLAADAADVFPGMAGSDYWGCLKGVYALDYGSPAWVPRMTGINASADFMMFVAMAENDIQTAYLAGSNASGGPDVMKTLDGGTTWTHVFQTAGNQNIGTGWCGSGGDRGWGYAECAFGLAVAPGNANRVAVSDYGFVHNTTDGGVSWHQAYVKPADENPPAATTPILKPYHTTGLENTSCWNMLWTDATHVFAGFSDIRGIRSDDGGSTWRMAANTTLNTTYHFLKNPSTGQLYAATSSIHDLYQTTYLTDAKIDAGDGEIMYSVNNGQSWTLLHDFNHPVVWLARHPSNPSQLYASVVHYAGGVGEGGIWMTGNLQSGSTSVWTRLPAPPRTEGHPLTVVVLNDGSLVCSYSARRNATGTFTASSGVFYRAAGATQWTDVSDPGMMYYTKDLVIDPHDVQQNTWYACVWDGWGGPANGPGGLYRTVNRGLTWTRILSQPGRISSVTVSPSAPGDAWITTERNGLWHCADITKAVPTFSPVTTYPFRQPERVFFNPYKPAEMWVTSFGNGLRTGMTSTTGLVHGHRPVEFKVFPNPVRSRLTVCSFEEPAVGIEIYNLAGELLMRMPSPGHPMPRNASGCVDVDVALLPRGTAFVKIYRDTASATERVVLE